MILEITTADGFCLQKSIFAFDKKKSRTMHLACIHGHNTVVLDRLKRYEIIRSTLYILHEFINAPRSIYALNKRAKISNAFESATRSAATPPFF